MHPVLRQPAIILQHPHAPVCFDGPTAAEIAAAKAKQREEREEAGVCPDCGATQQMHMDSSGCFYLGCPKGWA